jgi:hypothetical protein
MITPPPIPKRLLAVPARTPTKRASNKEKSGNKEKFRCSWALTKFLWFFAQKEDDRGIKKKKAEGQGQGP